jgi:hypothetical protein
MTDEMPFDIRWQLLYFLLEFLHTTLPEMPFTGFVRRTNGFYGLELTHAHERHMLGYMCPDILYLFCD